MTKCIAAWTHTYCSPQGERRLCCSSREPSTNFNQYIDSGENEKADTFHIPTLDEHWNSEHMKSVRRRMLDGEELPECQVCDNKLLNTDVYRDYFEHMFGHKWEEVLKNTDPDGTYNGNPISFDYRFSNLCNFKCRMCGPMLSSSWEAEAVKHFENYAEKEPWIKLKPELKKNSEAMYREMIDLGDQIEEIYWVGGEPLMFKEHWQIMTGLANSGQSKKVYARYNTNLSRTTFPVSVPPRGVNINLWELLTRFRDWQICASLDGTGVIGEYIRTGLNYNQFIENFEEGLEHTTNPRQMRFDFTLTTPGLFEVRNMFHLSKKYNVGILAKVCFEFDSSLAMCPLWLPEEVLHPIVQELLDELAPLADRNQQALIDVLTNLLERDTMENKYNDYMEGRKRGKARLQELENIRNHPIAMHEIFAMNSEAALDFWNGIG